MSYSAFPANIWLLIRCSKKVFHTTKAHYHQACPYPLSNPPWLIRNQWSMVNTIFDTLKWNQMDLYNQHPHNSQPCSTKSGLEQLPTQLSAHSNCLPHFQPYQPLHSEQHSLVPPFSHLWWARHRMEWWRTWSKESVGRRWEKESMLSQCLMMVVKVFVVAILFWF